jgi:hypothetical protein
MKKDTIWNIVLIVSIILIIHGISNTGDLDKKTAQAAQNEAVIGGVGVVASFISKKGMAQAALAVIPGWGWAAAVVVTLLMFVPGIIKNFMSIFRQPSVPGYVWIGAFLVILFMIMKRK